MNKPTLLELPSFMDDRGQFSPIFGLGNPNEIETVGRAGAVLNNVKRAYLINDSQKGVIRGFHYHEYETKYFTIVRGAAKFVTMGGWFDKDGGFCFKDDEEPAAFTLTERKSQLLVVPPKFCNGWVSLTEDSCLIAFSSSTFEESINDDRRIKPSYFEPYFGNLWNVGGR